MQPAYDSRQKPVIARATRSAIRAMLYGTALMAAIPAFAQVADGSDAGSTPGAATTPTTAVPAAQLTDAAPQADSEIVVTANRREQSVQSVGIAITAASGETMQALNVLRPEDLAKIAPGFTAIPNAGSSVSSFSIRGIGQADFSEHQEQPVAVYQDGVYVSSAGAAGFPIFDVARVEVLRGPQGTLFGRNATGGLVQFVSNKPTAGTSGSIEGTYGSRNLFRTQGFLNAGSDTVAGRVGFYYSRKDGFVHNLNGPDLLSEKVGGLRAQIKASLGSATEIVLRAEGFNLDGTASAGKSTPTRIGASGEAEYILPTTDANGTGPGRDLYGYRDDDAPFVQSVNDPGEIFKRSRTLAATLEHDFGDVTLYSTGSYGHVKIRYREDTDGTPLLQTRFGTGAESDTFSQEVRLQKENGAFRWIAGGYFLNIDGDYSVFYDVPSFCSPAVTTTCSLDRSAPGALPLREGSGGAIVNTLYSLRTRSVAFFGQGEYDLNDRVTFTLGGRYTWDNQRFDYRNDCAETLSNACGVIFGRGSRPDIVSSLGQITLRQKKGDWNGKAQLNFQATPDALFYASVSKGLKSAGFSAASDGLVLRQQLFFKPETLYAYEGGFKTTLLDRLATFNGAIYYYDYHDFQSFEFSGVSTSVVNRDATVRGVELELTVRPMAGLRTNVAVAFNDFRASNVPTPTAPSGETQRPINAPKWLVNWGATKEMRLNDALSIAITYAGRYTSSRFFNIVNTPIVQTPGFVLHDANLTLSSIDGWSLGVFANNFTDKVYANVKFDQTFNGYGLAHYGEPRTIGVTTGFKF